MRKVIRLVSFFTSLMLFPFFSLSGQKVEPVEGARLVHNKGLGQWGKNLKVGLTFVRTIGSLETEDENLAFYLPADLAVDKQGNLYILDSGNHRIQKFNSQGEYRATIGNKGQGPGEFYFPQSIDVDDSGNLYVSDPQNQRIQIIKADGKDPVTFTFHKEPIGAIRVSSSGTLIAGRGSTALSFGPPGLEEKETQPRLIKIIGKDGNILKEFGEPVDFKDFLVNRMGNSFHFALGDKENIYISFDYRNRIEKYSPQGKLLWIADRTLNYSTEPPKTKSDIQREGGRVMIREPKMNRCSTGIAVDEKGRVWVITLKRQLKEDEGVQTSVRVSMSGAERTMSMSVEGNTENKKTDMYELEVYSPEGTLLGKLPLDHFAEDIRINKDRLFLLDRVRGMNYYEYKIIER